ncbi:MAG TPA: sigma 54-interacting transcriptional regulator [Pyrinomonadaceae bacterium]|nr:sigma 54-interacting transcriptional regulator [Pyrinomonadaceae bacterium]
MTLSVVSEPQPSYDDEMITSVDFDAGERGSAPDFAADPIFPGIIGRSEKLRHILRLVELVAASDSTVLLLGETGTGKELIARAIHERSQRHRQAFVTLNCAAIPSSLFESELFGHERGAFTGANIQRAGRLELADRGTLFLDEVGEMPLELQPKLLRTLQEHTYERLGSSRSKNVDVRLVAATNCDLEEMMEEKQFRQDLFYRLNVFPIRIPPLRERPEDIPLLVEHFTQKYAREMGKQIDTIPESTIQKLQRWSWPGNVRELENLIERSVILTSNNVLAVALPKKMTEAIDAATIVSDFEEQQRIRQILQETKGRISGPNGAALRLGVKRSTLLDRMKKFGINPRDAKIKYAVSDEAAPKARYAFA